MAAKSLSHLSNYAFRPHGSLRSFEHVIREIRTAIVRGELEPGAKLPSEQELAQQFGVSRSALREALKSLELSGYVEVRRGYGGGTFISAPVTEEFTTIPPPPVPSLDVTEQQLLEVRLAIEPQAAGLAVGAKLDQQLAVRAATRELDECGDRPARLLAAVVNFHVAVARASGNPVFVAVLESLRPVIYRAFNKRAQSREWRDECRADHAAIVRAIESGDRKRAERAMFRHLRRGE